jgi:hypothetical protein
MALSGWNGNRLMRIMSRKIYRNRNNLNYCDRVEVERAFSLAKGKYGLGLIRARLKETTQSAIVLSILALNLSRIWCAFLQFLFELLFTDADFAYHGKTAFVQ